MYPFGIVFVYAFAKAYKEKIQSIFENVLVFLSLRKL